MAAGLGVADARACWPFVLARAGRSGMKAPLLEKLLQRCVDGAAVCLASPRGVVVVAPVIAGPIIRLVVMLAVSDGTPGAFAAHEHEMLEVASEFGAHELAFETERRGWARLLGREWVVRDGLYVRSVR